jgi:hypothetical protein
VRDATTSWLNSRVATWNTKEEVVPGGGFEPPTRGFSIRCSTN